jgi:hypothetical protein
VTAGGQWRLGGQAVPGEAVWKALGNSEAVGKAVRGEVLPAPVFGK